jgi:hypothetical protein
MKIIT